MDNENFIFLNQVLKDMRTLDQNGKVMPFSIKVRTFNRFTNFGGKLNIYPEAKLVMQEKKEKKDNNISLRIKRKYKERKNPNHYDNKTRNIKLPCGSIKKINILFIVEFNGKKVIY